MRLDLCVATYQRPAGLAALIASVQKCDLGEHELRLVIVDNDATGSARSVAESAVLESVYAIEPVPGIPAARNRCLDLVDRTRDALIFVDDDEIVTEGWLRELTSTASRFDADIVAGPVVSDLPATAPEWMRRGQYFQRKRFPTGPYAGLAATNNVLVRTSLLEKAGWPRFDAKFTQSGGSDTDFFHRLCAFAPRVAWADEAVVHEDIPAERAGIGWLWHRYLRAGNVTAQVRGESRTRVAGKSAARVGYGVVQGARSLVSRRVIHVRAMESVGRGFGGLLAAAGRQVTEYHRPDALLSAQRPLVVRPPRSTDLVSVVIPAFNCRATLGRQLKALSEQTYDGAVEVVIADNGSTDGLAADFAALTAGFGLDIRLADASGVRGVSHARNVGVQHSSGDLVLICDADDEVHEEWMADLVAAARDADVVGGSMTVERLNPGPERIWRPLPAAGTLPGKLNFLPFARGCNIAVWRDVLTAVGGWDESLVAGGDDADFSWRAQLAGYQLSAADRALVHYRLRPDMSGMARQVYRYSRSDAPLVLRFRSDGAHGSGLPRLVRDLVWILLALPKVGNVGWRGKIAARGAQLAGRIAGSIRYRVWAL